MEEILEIKKDEKDISFHPLDSDGEVHIEVQNHYMFYTYAAIYLNKEEIKSVIEFLQKQLDNG